MKLDDIRYNQKIRGSFVINNKEKLSTKMKRGENYTWIANYLFLYPCVMTATCRKALLLWRGYKVVDESRGMYASYFYDRWSYKWYYEKYWSFIKKDRNKLMQLTPLGMSLVDQELQHRLIKWDHEPRNITDMVVSDRALHCFLENRSLDEIRSYYKSIQENFKI